jgi:hypothetical protein
MNAGSIQKIPHDVAMVVDADGVGHYGSGDVEQ